jgi:myo-inositol 2-dehydrogenase/D-chiro-inositol 1-dehydrogenase
VSTETAPIGIALIGAGWAGTRHAEAYRALPDRGRIVAVVDTRAAIARARARDWGVPFATDDLAATLARPDVDAVDICLPHMLHAEVTEAALAAGKHVLVEKPFATSLAEADAMIQAAARARRFLMVAENVRYDAVYLRMAQLIAAGAIGVPFLCRICRDHHLHESLRARPWFLTDPTGGIMWSGGIHDIETVRMLMGDAPFREVYATAARGTLAEMTADDTSVGVFRMDGGGVALLSESFSTHAPHGARIRVEVFGPGGSLLTDGDGALTVVTPDGTRIEQVTMENTFTAEIRHFLDCIRVGDEPATAAWAMRPGLAAILAAQTSIALSAPITPEPLRTIME